MKQKIHERHEDCVISCKTRCQNEHRFGEMVRDVNGNDVLDVTDRFFVC